MSSVACPAVQYFSTLSHKRNDFKKKKKKKKKVMMIQHKICVLIFSTTMSETSPISKKNSRRYYLKVQRSTCKVPVKPVIF